MKLRPCPFCGSEAKVVNTPIKKTILCTGSCPLWFWDFSSESEQELIERWNKRHNEPPMVDEVPNLDSQRRDHHLDAVQAPYPLDGTDNTV